MTCNDLRTLFPDECPTCCSSCHSDAEDGYNDELLLGLEPCCALIMFAVERGLDPDDDHPKKTQ